MEIERKWLFDVKLPLSSDKFERFIDERFQCQGYLSVNREVRIRSQFRASTGEKDHVLAIKGEGSLKRIEVEKDLTEEEFKELLIVGGLEETDLIHKHCWDYTLSSGDLLVIGYSDTGTANEFVYGEIEFETEEKANSFVAPEWFGEEVTEDPTYKMVNYWRRTRENLL